MRSKKPFAILSIITVLTISAFWPSLASSEISIWKYRPIKKTLANGLTFIYQQDESSALTVLYILIKGGKRAAPPEKRGLSYLTTRLAVEIPDKGKIQALMNQASRVTVGTKGDYSFIKISCLSESLEETLKIVIKIMTKPLFSGLRLKSIKEQMLNYKKTAEDDPLPKAHTLFLDSLIADKGYGGSVYGGEDTLKKIEKKDAVSFYQNYFKGFNIIAAVSSNLTQEKLLDICRPYLEKFEKGNSASLIQLNYPSNKNEKQIFIAKEAKQTLVSLGYPLPEMTAKNSVMAFILENFLGKGPGSKLWPLRQQQKLAYNVDCRVTEMKEGGLLEAYLETDQAKVATALVSLKKILNKLCEEGLTEDEFRAAKIQSKASFLRNMETKENRALNLAAFEALGLGYNFLDNFFEELAKITLNDINSYLRQVLNPDQVVEVIIGPQEKRSFRLGSLKSSSGILQRGKWSRTCKAYRR